MNHNRTFNLIIVAVLLVLAAVTIQQFGSTVRLVSAGSSRPVVSQSEAIQNSFACPFTPEQIRSIHSEYVKEIGFSLPFTKDGPTGIDGGLTMLRYCKTP